MKDLIFLFLFMGVLGASCNKECRSYNEKNMNIILMENGENVSDQYGDQQIRVRGFSVFGSVKAFDFDYDLEQDLFSQEIEEICPNESTLIYVVEFLPDTTRNVLDTFDFAVTKNGGGKKCVDCTIDEITSRGGNEIQIGEEEILLYLAL